MYHIISLLFASFCVLINYMYIEDKHFRSNIISYSLKLHGGDIIVRLENHACYNWRSHVIV